MTRRSVSTEITTSLPEAIPLRDAELEVLFEFEAIIREEFRAAWVGWKYEGRSPSAPRLVSHDAWTSYVETTGERPAIAITNRATTKKGEFYAAHVARSKGARPEWEVIDDDVEANIVPDLAAALGAAFAAAYVAPGKRRRKVRTTGGDRVTLDLEL